MEDPGDKVWIKLNGIPLPEAPLDLVESLVEHQQQQIRSLGRDKMELEASIMRNRHSERLWTTGISSNDGIIKIKTESSVTSYEPTMLLKAIIGISLLFTLAMCTIDVKKEEDTGSTTHINQSEDKSDFGYKFD